MTAATMSCKGGGTTPDPVPTQYQYTILASNRNVFNEQDIGGKVIIETDQGTYSGSNNPTIVISTTNNTIKSIKVDIPNFNNSYIMTKDQTASVIYTMDEKGPHQFSLNPANKTITIINYVIPASFNTTLFAQCIGNSPDGSDLGDGTVQNWNKDSVDVGAMNYGAEPSAQTLEYGRQAADIINEAAKGTMFINYIGKVADLVESGCTHLVYKDNNWIHAEINVTDNVYQKSVFYTLNVGVMAGLATILEEMMNSNSGIR